MHAGRTMSAQIDTDIADAINALRESQHAIDERLDGQTERIAALKVKRRRYLYDAVQRLVPDISSGSLRRLQQEMPEFIDASVQSAFADHRKFLGLFAGADYRQALLGLQTRLAHQLEGGRDPVMRESGDELAKLLADRDELTRLQGHTQDILDQLQRLQDSDAPLPAAISEEIARIAEKARAMALENAQRKKKQVRQSVSEDEQDDDASDDDAWIYFASTLSSDVHRSALMHGGGGSYDGAGASADYRDEPASTSRFRERDSDTQNSTGMAMAAGYLMAESSAVESSANDQDAGDDIGVGMPEIATDDSLGAFS